MAAEQPEETHPYGKWIRTSVDPSFEAQRLEQLLDRYASDMPQIRSLYQGAMALELDFFAAHIPAGSSSRPGTA